MKKLMVCLLAALTVFFSGCWSRLELTEMIIVNVLAIDKLEKPVGRIGTRVSVAAFKLGQASRGQEAGGPPPTWVSRSDGITIGDAIFNFNSRSPRRIFLAQSNAIIIGEKLAREGVYSFVDFLERNRQIRLRNKFFIAKGDASEIIGISPEVEGGIGRELIGVAKEVYQRTGKSADMDLKMFLEQMVDEGIDAVVPKVEKDEVKRQQGETPPPVVPAEEKSFTTLRVLGAAFFKKDKLAGWLNERETRGVLLARGIFKQGFFPVGDDEFPQAHISLRVTRARGEIKPEVTNGVINVVVKIKAEGELSSHGKIQELANEKKFSELEKEFAEALKDNVMAAWKLSQKAHADILGVGAALHRANAKAWRKVEQNWRDEWLPEVKLTVQAEAKLRRTGMIKDSLPPK